MFHKATRILETLEDYGFEAYIVGGYVRDSLLGLPSKDADIATCATPEEIVSLFGTANAKIIHPAEAFPVVLVHGMEVATFRLDLEAESRQVVKVAYTKNVSHDAARRDFTINALYMNRAQRILDPTGYGISDLENGLIRFVGDPVRRMQEDSLRALRAVRFAARFGFTFEPETEKALRVFNNIGTAFREN